MKTVQMILLAGLLAMGLACGGTRQPGRIDIAGKLPVTLPGLYPRGHGLEVKRK